MKYGKWIAPDYKDKMKLYENYRDMDVK